MIDDLFEDEADDTLIKQRATSHLSHIGKPNTETEHPRSALTLCHAVMAALLRTAVGVMSLKIDSKSHLQPLMAAVNPARSVSDREPAVNFEARETTATPHYLSKNIRDLQVMQDRET